MPQHVVIDAFRCSFPTLEYYAVGSHSCLRPVWSMTVNSHEANALLCRVTLLHEPGTGGTEAQGAAAGVAK